MQAEVERVSSPKRTPKRHSAAKDFSVWRQTCFIMAPKTRSKKLVDREAIKGPRLYKQQVATDREKKACVEPTLMLMLERRKSACKTSAVSNKILRWLTPLLGPNLDPKTGPKRRPIEESKIGSNSGPHFGVQIWAQKWGQPSENFAAARKCFASGFANQQHEHECQHKPFSSYASQVLVATVEVPLWPPCLYHFFRPCLGAMRKHV